MSLHPSNEPGISFQVSHSDGSIPNHPLGHYWRMQVGPGHFGDMHGPFSTEDDAVSDARAYIDERIVHVTARINANLKTMRQISR
jgi:hypothetical protein